MKFDFNNVESERAKNIKFADDNGISHDKMEEIYQNHSKKVYTFLLSKTCNHELAEELTQETFFCAVNSINKFKGNSSVLTWLCSIAQNLWLKYLRDNKSFEDLSNYEDMLTISSAEDELFIQWENV